jgi:hypothetical protein
MSWSTILAVMLAQPTWHGDLAETPEQRADLLRPVAMAIELATEDTTEQAALVALGWHESRWARYVVSGHCSDGPSGVRCDNGQARHPWQLHRSACPSAWALAEDDPRALERSAACAVRLLRGARGRCRGMHPAGDWAGAFSGFARGGQCTWAPAAGRARSMSAALMALEADR